MSTQKQRSFKRPLTWAFVFGAVGFVFAGIAPNWLLAEATTGHVLSGFLIAPFMLAVGLALGILSELLRFKELTDRRLLLTAASLAAAIILAFAAFTYTSGSPDVLIEAYITGCEDPQHLIGERIRHWENVVAKSERHGAPYRANWQQGVPAMLRETPGAVLSLRVVRQSAVHTHRWRWGDPWFTADSWTPVDQTKKVFAHGDTGLWASCDQLIGAKARFWMLDWEKSEGVPPTELPEFLMLYVVKPVPAEYERFLPATR